MTVGSATLKADTEYPGGLAVRAWPNQDAPQIPRWELTGGRLVSTCTRQPVPFARTPCVPAYILMDGEGRTEEQISEAANHELPGVAPRAGA